MFRNLEAEQARKGLTDLETANLIGIARVTYASKKATGSFKLTEIFKLCNLFDCKFEYLFATDDDQPA